MVEATLFLSVLIAVAVLVVIYDAIEREKRAIEREKIFQKWIFESLYSINHKVLLPEGHDKKEPIKFATVYNPQNDPMREYKGGRSDL